jgi:hypothetical protein
MAAPSPRASAAPSAVLESPGPPTRSISAPLNAASAAGVRASSRDAASAISPPSSKTGVPDGEPDGVPAGGAKASSSISGT